MKKILLNQCFLLLAFSIQAQVTFEVTKTGTTTEIDAAIDHAFNLWSQYLNSEVPIKVNLIYTDLGSPNIGGFGIPNLEKDFEGAFMNDVWYASSLANSIAETELNAGEFDMEIYMNSQIDYFYFGTDGNPTANESDFVTVLMHEVAHGLGAVTIGFFDNGEGSFGAATFGDIAPILPSFWVASDTAGGYPTIWDKFLINGDDQLLTDESVFPNSSIALGDAFESDDIFFNGVNATAANNGMNPKIYAPTTFNAGSSIGHFDEATFPTNSGNGMNTPQIKPGEVIHSPGPILLGALQDIGWDVNLSVGVDEHLIETIQTRPNPSGGIIHIDLRGSSFDLKVFDLAGRVVIPEVQSGINNFSNLENGIYILFGIIEDMRVSERLVISK